MHPVNRSLPTLLAVLALLLTPVVAHAATPLEAILSIDNATTNPGDVARVRVFHASPDAPNVDVRVDGGLAFADVAFQEVTDYAALPAGTYRVQVEPAGADGSGPFVIDAELTLDAGTDYTVAAQGLLANIAPLPLVDDNMAPADGQARVRVVHLSPDAPPVDVALTDGPVLVPNLAFGEATDDYLAVDAGSYDLEVRVAGTDTAVLTLPGTVLAAGDVYTVFATGLVAQGAADRTLYLNDERFRVEVEWTDFQGNSGFGRPVPETNDSGFFWFFNPDNIELVVKALDGRGVNDRFWFFYGALSNVEYTITVTDTETGETETYFNPSGTFASRGDTDAFPGN